MEYLPIVQRFSWLSIPGLAVGSVAVFLRYGYCWISNTNSEVFTKAFRDEYLFAGVAFIVIMAIRYFGTEYKRTERNLKFLRELFDRGNLSESHYSYAAKRAISTFLNREMDFQTEESAKNELGDASEFIKSSLEPMVNRIVEIKLMKADPSDDRGSAPNRPNILNKPTPKARRTPPE